MLHFDLCMKFYDVDIYVWGGVVSGSVELTNVMFGLKIIGWCQVDCA